MSKYNVSATTGNDELKPSRRGARMQNRLVEHQFPLKELQFPLVEQQWKLELDEPSSFGPRVDIQRISRLETFATNITQKTRFLLGLRLGKLFGGLLNLVSSSILFYSDGDVLGD